MSLEQIYDYVRSRTGLDPASLGSTSVTASIGARQRALGLPDVAAYADVLIRSSDELDSLVDELVVAETWFFRGGSVFAYMAQYARTLIESRAADRPVRILSVPCSTGEEPYSLAIAMTEAGLSDRQWRLDAVDISRRHLQRARRGRFGEFSFRQTDRRLRSSYFQPCDEGWEIRESLRSAVCFRQANVVDPDFLRDEPAYDLIFCRNLLIYLHDSARRQVMATLDRLLAPAGLICAGHAEPLSSLDSRYRQVGHDSHFLFSRMATVEPHELLPVLQPERKEVASSASAQSPRTIEAPRPRRMPLALPVTTETLASTDFLVAARRLADAGQLDQAMASCQKHLTAAGPSAELYSLWGTICQAQGDDVEARRRFDKALYLEPDHHEALVHLMLLCQRVGDNAQAAALHRRLERSAARGDA